MEIAARNFRYNWVDHWARLPDSPSVRENGRTHGVVVAKDGRVFIFCQANPAVCIFSPAGELVDSWGDRFAGAHGMTLVEEDGTEFLWLTDQGTGEVVKTTLDGKTVLNLERPRIDVYTESKYSPTWVAVNEERLGGNGDIWAADGYGSNRVNRYDKAGRYLGGIDGTEGAAGAFKCPHGIWTNARHGDPELYVADRGNRRIQVYAMDGKWKGAFGEEYLSSPDCFCTAGDLLVIPELYGRLALLNIDDQLVGFLGEQTEVKQLGNWPNVDASDLHEGKFNSPHGAGADAAGNIYVVEWIIGGRITKLEKI